MKTVTRESLMDYQTYEEHRDAIRSRAMAAKALRRIHVGAYLTFLFENQTTVHYQVQEMMRAERIVREADIQYELQTYNELLGAEGELGCTLLIEIATAAERDVLLREWLDLPPHLYCRLEDGRLIRARYDERQIGETRLSSVQYLKFATEGAVPVAIGSDLPALKLDTPLSEAQRQALAEDLRS